MFKKNLQHHYFKILADMGVYEWGCREWDNQSDVPSSCKCTKHGRAEKKSETLSIILLLIITDGQFPYFTIQTDDCDGEIHNEPTNKGCYLVDFHLSRRWSFQLRRPTRRLDATVICAMAVNRIVFIWVIDGY